MAADLTQPQRMSFTPRVTGPEVFAETAAQYLAGAISDAARDRDSVAVALSGGRGPRPVFERLARIPGVPWGRVEFFFADERAVPADHADSNYRLVHEALVSRLPLAPRAIHRMAADQPDLDSAAAAYERILPPVLDVLVLGIGEDGHTASLFPGMEAVREQQRRVVPATGPAPPHQRLTITPPVIASARMRIMLVSGENKARSVARACEGPWDPFSCPAQLARDGCWIMDRAAASLLVQGPT